MRSWLMKMTEVLVRLMLPVSLRSAWLIRRACRPMCESPMSPSISAFGHKRGHGVDHDHVDRAGADQGVDDLKRLLAGIGLGDQQLVEVDAEAAGVERVERVLGIDIGRDAAHALGLGDDVQGEGGLTGRFRTVDLGDPAARDAADAEGEVERDASRSGSLDLHGRAGLAHLHDRALAELALDLGDGHFDCAVALAHAETSFQGMETSVIRTNMLVQW